MPGFTKEGLDILLYALICMKSMLPSYLWPYCIRIICLLLCFLTRLEFIECGYHVSFTSVSPTSNIGCGWKKMLNTGLLNYTELSSLVQSIEEIFYSSKKVTLSTQSLQLSISLVKKKKNIGGGVINYDPVCWQTGFPGGSVVNMPANAGDVGFIPGSGRSPGGGNGNPLQDSCQENFMDRGAW